MTERVDTLADSSYPYDVFISYNRADRAWVWQKLLPRLEAANVRALTPDRDFIPGWPRRRNIDRAVASSRHTIAVLTPAFVKDDWDILATMAASDDDPLALQLKLLPLLLAECQLPETITALSLDYLDFTDERNWKREFGRLIRTLKTPLPQPRPRIIKVLVDWINTLSSARNLLRLSLATLILVSVVLLFQLPSLLKEIEEARQPDGLLFVYWPAPTATPTSIPTPTPIPPMPDDGSFNIAIAQFTRLDTPSQSSIFVRDIQNLSKRLYTTIEKDFSCPVPVHFRGPEEVQPASGKPTFAENSDLRALEAQEYAHSNNVHLLIYGVITHTDNYFVQPEFYISSEDFDYGSEVVGSDRLGRRIPLNLPLDKPENWFETQLKLYARTQALQYLICGLAHFYVNNYDKAWDQFQQAAMVQDWEEDEGKEVVYLLMGAAKLRAYRNPKTKQRTEALNAAFEAFKRASELNDDYARSYLGLGNVAFQQATVLNPQWPNNVDQARLREAEYRYTQSLKAADQPASAHIPFKAAYGLGQIYSFGHQYAKWSGEQARDYFNQVITPSQVISSPELIWFVGNAHVQLAWLAYFDKDWPVVSSECEQATELLEQITLHPPENQIAAHCQAWIAVAEKELGDLDRACEAYNSAISLGQQSNVPEVEDWKKAQLALNC